MGITGLLPLLKPVTKDTHIREFKGLTVGIDTYCWLHKGIYSCSAELCQGIPTDKFIKYCVERVHLLLSHGVRPYLVFDGGYLPAKAGKEAERRTKREANMQRGKQLLREGNTSGAHQFFSKAADVTPLMAHKLIQVIKHIPGVKYVVAPYEADAQLGFLARNGHVDAVITEDSDILLFGCTRVMFKLDRDGTGQEIDLQEVFSRRNDELDMRGMTEDDLMTLCALSGCDYLPSLHGVGLKKAHRLVSRHKELPKILRAVKFESAGGMPQSYEADFHRALLTFRHQRAFDPVSRTVVNMTPLPEKLPVCVLVAGGGGGSGGDRALDFLGPPVEAERGSRVADGEVDPITGEPFTEMSGEGCKSSADAVPETTLSESAAAALASWRGISTSAPRGGGKSRGAVGSSKKVLSAQGNNLTKYWGPSIIKKTPERSESAEARSAVSGGERSTILDRSFELDAAPDRPREEATEGVRERVGFLRGVAGTPRRRRGDVPEKEGGGPVSPDLSPICVSPGSFYGGLSPPAAVHSSEDKENQDPLLLGKEKKLEAAPAAAVSTSKHFGGGRAAVSSAPSGLRRRFRPPLAVVSDMSRRSATPAVAGACCGGGGRVGGGDSDAWATEHTYSRLGVQPESKAPAAGGRGVGGGGAGGVISGPGSLLKRRRTLGLGSVASKGLIRGLDGGMLGRGSGVGGTGPRSKSLSGVPGEATLVAQDVDENDAAVGNACAHNLFERFAASSRPCPTGRVQEEAPDDAKSAGDKRKKEHVGVGVTREGHRGGALSSAGVDSGGVLSENCENTKVVTRASPRCLLSSGSSALARQGEVEKEGEEVYGNRCPDKAFSSHGLRDALQRNDRMSEDEGGAEDSTCSRSTGGEGWAAPKLPAAGASVAAAVAAVKVDGHHDGIFARFVYTS